MTKFQTIAERISKGEFNVSDETMKVIGLMAKFNAVDDEVVTLLNSSDFSTTDDLMEYQEAYYEFFLSFESLLLKAVEFDIRPVDNEMMEG